MPPNEGWEDTAEYAAGLRKLLAEAMWLIENADPAVGVEGWKEREKAWREKVNLEIF